MNVFEKIAEARLKLKQAGLKQSGRNKGLNYSYFDLCDILPRTTVIERELGLLSVVSFTDTEGVLTMINTEKPEEVVVFKSPLKEAKVGSCQPVQNLGAMETYVRRYLYLLAYEIVETDALDKDGESEKETRVQRPQKSKAKRIQELIAGTDITAEDITRWIEKNFGEPIKVNDLSDEQFNMLYAALERTVN